MVVVVVDVSISDETTLDDTFLGRLDTTSRRRPISTAIIVTIGRLHVDHRSGGHLLGDGGQSERRPAAEQGVRHRSPAGLTKTSTVVVL
jgi:hypothetical protein